MRAQARRVHTRKGEGDVYRHWDCRYSLRKRPCHPTLHYSMLSSFFDADVAAPPPRPAHAACR